MMKSFLPALKGLLAHQLGLRGHSQSKIALALDVTQAAVSQYFSKGSDYFRRRLLDLGLEDEQLQRYVNVLCEDLETNPIEANLTLYTIWRNLIQSGRLLHSHQRGVVVTGRCEICGRLFGVQPIDPERGEVISELEAAIRLIEASPQFTTVMPQVSVNLVMALSNAVSEEDVAAIPGRIVRVREKAVASMKPEFGVSRHMAQMLLTARRFARKIRAAINIKHDKRIESILRKQGFEVHKTVDKREVIGTSGDLVVAALAVTLSKLRRTPMIVVDEGGVGLEPNTYIFGRTATKVVEIAIQVSKIYAKREAVHI